MPMIEVLYTYLWNLQEDHLSTDSISLAQLFYDMSHEGILTRERQVCVLTGKPLFNYYRIHPDGGREFFGTFSPPY